jgi:hypothetical protein
MDYDLGKARWYFDRGVLLPWAENHWATHNPVIYITDTIVKRYCFGMAMEKVYEAIRMKIDLELMAMDEIIRDPSVMARREIFYVPEIFEIIFSYSCLIQDSQRIRLGTERTNSLLFKVKDQVEFPEYGELCREIALQHDITPELMQRVETVASKRRMRPDNDIVLHIAKRNEAKFNELLRNEHLRPQLRRYHVDKGEELNPSELFSLNGLVIAAFAVHYGLKLSFKDPAIPIWDFPIGKAFPERIVQ